MRYTVHVTVRRICAPSANVKDKIVKFSKNYGTFAIKESGGGESIINGSLNSKIIIIICQNSSGKSREFSRSRMTKRTAPLIPIAPFSSC